MTSSRGVVLFEALFILTYLAAQVFSQPSGTIRLIKQFLLPGIAVSLAALVSLQPAIDNFVERATSTGGVSNRIIGDIVQPFKFAQYKDLDGYGTGAAHPGSQRLRSILKLPVGEEIAVGYEGEMGRVMLELGPFGFLFWYGLRFGLIIALWLDFCRLKIPFLRQLALAACLTHVIQVSGQLVFNHTFSVYYWFLSGFIFLLPRLEQIENWYHEQQLSQQNISSSYLSHSSHRKSFFP